MTLKIPLFLARKDLFQDKKIFALIITAVIFGVGIQIPNAANLDGSNEAILDRTVNVMSGHLTILNPNGSELLKVKENEAVLDEFSWVKGYTARSYMAGIVSHDERSSGMDIIGIQPEKEQGLSNLEEFLVEGEYLYYDETSPDELPPESNVTVLGDEFAEKIGAEVGDFIGISFSQNQTIFFKVIGLLNIGIGGVDERTVFVYKSYLDALFGTENQATEILIKTADPYDVDDHRDELSRHVVEGKVLTWKEKMNYVEDIVHANGQVKLISQIMTIIGVVVPVAVLMYVNVKNRHREIGILIATGTDSKTIFLTFLFEALLIAIIGCTGGVALGLLICLYFNFYPVVDRPNFVVTPLISFDSVFFPFFTIFLATIAAAIIPAYKASKINPIKAIWGE